MLDFRISDKFRFRADRQNFQGFDKSLVIAASFILITLCLPTCRGFAQEPEKIFQQALAVKIPTHLQGEVIGPHHRVKEERIVIRALIRRGGVAFQNETARAGFPMQEAKFPASHHQWSLCFSGDFIRFAGGCQTGGLQLPINYFKTGSFCHPERSEGSRFLK